jgi:hypothetical protein
MKRTAEQVIHSVGVHLPVDQIAPKQRLPGFGLASEQIRDVLGFGKRSRRTTSSAVDGGLSL